MRKIVVNIYVSDDIPADLDTVVTDIFLGHQVKPQREDGPNIDKIVYLVKF